MKKGGKNIHISHKADGMGDIAPCISLDTWVWVYLNLHLSNIQKERERASIRVLIQGSWVTKNPTLRHLGTLVRTPTYETKILFN